MLTVRGQVVEGGAVNTDRTVFIGLAAQLSSSDDGQWRGERVQMWPQG